MLHPRAGFDSIHLPPTSGSWNALLEDFATTLVDVPAFRAPPPSMEVGLAPHSESNLVTGFEGIDGLFVATWDDLAIGDYVDLTIHLPGGIRVEVGGRVDWLRDVCGAGGPGIGLRFIGLDSIGARVLARFAALREPIFHA